MKLKVPQTPHMPIQQFLLVIMVCMFNFACTALQTDSPGSDQTSGARALASRGEHAAASRAYLNLAVSSTGDQRQRYLIFAAGEMYLANDVEGAERILNEAGANIAETNLEIWAEITAEIKLAQNLPGEALQALNRVSSTERQSAASRILLLRSEALFRLGRPEAAVATLLKRERVLSKRDDIEANRKAIWTGLQGAGTSIPANPVASNGDPVLTGWLQLGYISFSKRGSLNQLYNSLEQWQRNNPNHPATRQLLGEVLSNLSALSNYPQQVALLLPLSGKQRGVGEAIRDGYLAAHFDIGRDGQRPDIYVYDTNRGGAVAAYQQAVVQGARFVVGPLLKEEIGAIAPLVKDVSTLALNNGPDNMQAPAGFFQFALAPEDEARAVARRAVGDGLHNAIAFVPNNDWGRRILSAFQQELNERGGTLLKAGIYQDNAPDFTTVIQNTLLLNESYARRDRLSANLGKKLEFEPRRRQDVDFIFMAAEANTARLFKPQLRFHYAGEIPTYATSAVFQPDSSDNADINGVIFPDIPWLLDPNQQTADNQSAFVNYWGPGATRLTRFYAMGYDAYYLTALLHGRTDLRQLSMSGATGQLHVDQTGVVHRNLKWARFERGKMRKLPDSPRALTQDATIVLTQQ